MPSEEHEKSGARRAVGGQGHCAATYISEPLWFRHCLGCRGLFWLQEWVPAPPPAWALHALPALLLHQRKGESSALIYSWLQSLCSSLRQKATVLPGAEVTQHGGRDLGRNKAL